MKLELHFYTYPFQGIVIQNCVVQYLGLCTASRSRQPEAQNLRLTNA